MRDHLKFLLFTVLFWFVTSDDDHLPKVTTPQGKIKGYYKVSEYGKLYAAYEGVPYARPPVGNLRFEPPEPVEPWPGELIATNLPPKCLQYIHMPIWAPSRDNLEGSEDCLYLNIYVPDKEDENFKENSSLPVILWIHGGAFMFGSANLHGEKYIMNKNVIFIAINYRVGPLGFLSTEDDVVPGNMGLKDQSMALKWVHDNIQYFGGDPQKITLAGLSAGGASVHYHYFSPLSAGLFRNGISMSGTALHCWAQTENSLEKAEKLAMLLGCPTNNTKIFVECLKYRPAKSIVNAVGDFLPWLYNPFSPFGPVVEKFGDKPFISKPPAVLLKDGNVQDVPWLTSATSSEGLYPSSEFINNERLLKELNDDWNRIIPHLLDFNFTVPVQLHNETSMKIRKHYFDDDLIESQNSDKLIKMVGDRLFNVDAEKAAKMQANLNKSPVLFYYYDYRAAFSLSDLFSGSRKDFGVSHGDDGFLIFENLLIDSISPLENDEAMRNSLLHAFELFANNQIDKSFHEDFGLDWKKISPSGEFLDFLHIVGPPDYPKMVSERNFGDKIFWNTINFSENVVNDINSKKDEL